MRILMVTAQYPFPVAGGAERQAHELARTLVRKGHSVQVLSTAFDPTQSAEETIDDVQVHRVPWVEERAQRFVRSPARMLRILFRIRGQADVVHLHNLSSFCAFVGVLAKLAGIPVVTKLPNFGGTSGSGNDSKYFQTTKKGEIHELKEELGNPKARAPPRNGAPPPPPPGSAPRPPRRWRRRRRR